MRRGPGALRGVRLRRPRLRGPIARDGRPCGRGGEAHRFMPFARMDLGPHEAFIEHDDARAFGLRRRHGVS